jgi:hypothetical protein
MLWQSHGDNANPEQFCGCESQIHENPRKHRALTEHKKHYRTLGIGVKTRGFLGWALWVLFRDRSPGKRVEDLNKPLKRSD